MQCGKNRFLPNLAAGDVIPCCRDWNSSRRTSKGLQKLRTLSRGLGRSYGDSSLPAPGKTFVVDTTLADRLLGFDPETGLLRAEAGVSLLELNRVFLRRGWFVPVSPGTQFVTLGGMVASDVHGKNHHVDGCFGEHVHSLQASRGRRADRRMFRRPRAGAVPRHASAAWD